MHCITQALRVRVSRKKAGLLLGSALLSASAAAAPADIIKSLQGAWVLESTECTQVFEKVQGKVRFKDRTFASESGFIISGDKARGPAGGVCTISGIEEENDQFSARLSCTDTLVSRNFAMVFRIIDDTHFDRLDPERPELTREHKKCSL